MVVCLVVSNGHIDDILLVVGDKTIAWVDETLVGSKVQSLVAAQHLLVQGGIHLYAILLHQALCRHGVALALYALYLGKQLAYVLAQGGVVVYLEHGLALSLYELHGRFGAEDAGPIRGLLQAPMCYESAVAHVRLLYLASGLDAHELRHESVEHISIVVALPCIGCGSESQLMHLLVGNVV